MIDDGISNDLRKVEQPDASREIRRLERALEDIRDMPVSAVNDSESLRHSIRTMQMIARSSLSGRLIS